MDSVAGFSGPDELFNVQIMNLTSSTGEKMASADHYIYMDNTRLDYSDSLVRQQAFDQAAKNFVADLLVFGGTSSDDMQDFLQNDYRVYLNPSTGIYEIYPLGVPQS